MPIIKVPREGLINYQAHTSNLKLKKGFTITEIILLLVIVGIMISGLLPIFLNVITVNKSTEYRSAAYKAADAKLEALRYGPYDDMVVGTKKESVAGLPGAEQLTVITTNVVDSAPQTNIKKVTIKVAWNFKRPEEVKLVSYIARNGIKK